MTPKILHIDMNKFYASVEQMLNPQLKNKAIAVCGSTEERHGIVLTASAEAKARGVKTGMANWEARRACPGLIVVPPQYDQYCKYSKLARAVYGRYSDRIEPYGMKHMSFPVDDFGMNIRAEVKAYNFGFSTAKNLASVIRANDKVTVVTFALPTHACFRPNGLGICPQNVTIIANSRYADQALKLKQAYPDLRIFLDPRVHAKMTLASSGKVWLAERPDRRLDGRQEGIQ